MAKSHIHGFLFILLIAFSSKFVSLCKKNNSSLLLFLKLCKFDYFINYRCLNPKHSHDLIMLTLEYLFPKHIFVLTYKHRWHMKMSTIECLIPSYSQISVLHPNNNQCVQYLNVVHANWNRSCSIGHLLHLDFFETLVTHLYPEQLTGFGLMLEILRCEQSPSTCITTLLRASALLCGPNRSKL